MGLSWQQGPLGGATVGRFLTPEPLPQRLLFAEPLRRRMRVKLAGEWIADSEDVVLLHEPGSRKKAAWSYPQAWPEVARVSNLVSFEPDKIDVLLDDKKLALAPGQSVVPHGIDRGLDPGEMLERGDNVARPRN